jgi:glycosyltransferase involved in cell wall biosynthesis
VLFKFSVIIATYNRAELIEECIDSVLNQSEENFELILVDDASTDDTQTRLLKIQDSRVKIITLKQNAGRQRARNIAISHANSHYIAILDSDDIMYKHRLATQGNFLDANPDYVMVGGRLNGHSRPPKYVISAEAQSFDARFMLVKDNIFDHSSVTIRSQILRRLNGPYKIKHNEDYFLYSDLIAFGKFGYLIESVGEYRYHPGQVSLTLPYQSQQETKRIRRRILARALLYGAKPGSTEAYSMKVLDYVLLIIPTFVYNLLRLKLR